MTLCVVRGPAIDMDTWWKRLSPEQRDELRALKARHTDQQFVVRFEYDLIDAPLLRLVCAVKVPSADGRYFVSVINQDCGCGDDGKAVHLLRHTVQFALREPLPEWWQHDAISLAKAEPDRLSCKESA